MTDTTISLHYAVEIDCSDITTDSNTDIGLYAGKFKWITDRPGYAATSGLKLITRGFLNSMKYVITRGFSTSESQSTWKQGIIKSLGQPNRLINILSGGDYGTLSGFTFEVDNTSVDGSGIGDNFSTVLFENDYFVISRKVRFYVVIGDVFYNAWSGIVTSTDYDELSYKFQCQDDFKTIHKPLPPKVIDKYLFPNVSSQDEGKTIPICLGLVEHAELLNVLSMTDALDILKKESAVYRLAPIIAYVTGTKTYTILTGEIYFKKNHFKNHYLKHVLAGDGQVVKIVSNTSGQFPEFGNSYAVFLVLEENLTETPVLYTISATTEGSWVEIYNFDSSYIASNDIINEYYENENGLPVLEYWNKDYNSWNDVSETIQYYSNLKISNSIVFPGLKLLSKSVNFDGTYTKYSAFTPKSVIYDGHTKTPGTVITTDLAKGTDYSKLRDRAYNTYETIVYRTADLSVSTVKIYFLVEYPDNMKKEDYDEIYLLMDSSIESDKNMSDYDYDFNVAVGDSLRLKTFITKIECDVYSAQNLTADTPLETILIPEIYYNTGTDNQTLFNSLKSSLILTSFYDSAIKFRAYPFLKIELEHYMPAIFFMHDTTLNFRQVCFVAVKTVNLTSEKVYTRLSGEHSSYSDTNNIAYIFKHLLQVYDELDGIDDISYGSFVSDRSGWKAGRQITEKKSSKEYLQELCRQSFTCIYPTIDGKRGVKAFRDDTSFSSLVHSTANGTIIADSISRFELSDINQVYNSFDIKYSFNPASGKFEKHIYVHNPEKTYFPHRLATEGTSNAAAADADTITFTSVSIDISDKSRALFLVADTSGLSVGDCISFVDGVTLNKSFYYGQIVSIDDNVNINVEFDNLENWLITDTTATGTLYNHYSSIVLWKTYAGGLTNYTTASSHWTACRNSYLRTGKISPLPESLGLCHWFVEESNFYPNSPGDNSTAHKYLAELIEWTTRQKEIVEYQIPITAANVAIELLTPVTFSDLKYTNSTNRQGYITKIKINPEVDTISIEATLEPADIDDLTGCNIQETGLSADTIQETGSQTNDYQETGLC